MYFSFVRTTRHRQVALSGSWHGVDYSAIADETAKRLCGNCKPERLTGSRKKSMIVTSSNEGNDKDSVRSKPRKVHHSNDMKGRNES